MVITAPKILHLVAAIIFALVAGGLTHAGVLALEPVGFFFLALGFVV